jgi:hypothetical protein
MSEPDPRDALDEPLLRVSTAEDAGAQTQSRYAFQWNCAVPFVLATLATNLPAMPSFVRLMRTCAKSGTYRGHTDKSRRG